MHEEILRKPRGSLFICILGIIAIYISELITPHPKYANLLYTLGFEAQKNHHEAKAETYYKRSIYFDPLHAYAYFRLGIQYRGQGDSKKAIEYLQKAALHDSRFFKDFDDFGLYYLNLGRYDTAIQCFQISIRMTRRNLSRYHLGIAYLKSERRDKALAMVAEIYNLGSLDLAEKLQNLIDDN